MSAPKVKPVNPWAMPDGQLVLPADAPRDQWLEERRRGIGGSDIPLLMGVSAYGTEYELWLDKTGRAEHKAQTEAMRRGNWLEPHVVGYFADETKLAVRRCGLVAHRESPILRATPDRLTDDGGCLEVKTIGTWAHVNAEWRDGGMSRHAYVQGQWQLLITGRTHLWLCAYAIDQEPMIRGPIERDDALIDRMRKRVSNWWDTHVIGDEPPPVDLDTITDEEIALRWPTEEPGATKAAEWPAYLRAMLAERAEVLKFETEAAKRKKEIDQALKVMIGDAESLLVGDRPVMTLKTQKNSVTTVLPALEFDHPEIWADYIKRGTHRHLRIVKGWENA
jgi:putative phage-type endonuclease